MRCRTGLFMALRVFTPETIKVWRVTSPKVHFFMQSKRMSELRLCPIWWLAQ